MRPAPGPPGSRVMRPRQRLLPCRPACCSALLLRASRGRGTGEDGLESDSRAKDVQCSRWVVRRPRWVLAGRKASSE